MKNHEVQEAEIIGENPSRDYKKSSGGSRKTKNSRNSGQKFREHDAQISRNNANADFNDFAKMLRRGKIIAILVLILLVCLFGLILKFLVGILAWLLQFIIVIVAVALVVALVYNFAKGKR